MGGLAAHQAAQQAAAPAAMEEDGATEIISADSLPDFANMFGGGGASQPAQTAPQPQQPTYAQMASQDGTVEMQNPMAFLRAHGMAGDGGATEVASPDMLGGLAGPTEAIADATELVSGEDMLGGFGMGQAAQPASSPNPFSAPAPSPHALQQHSSPSFNAPAAAAPNPFGQQAPGPPALQQHSSPSFNAPAAAAPSPFDDDATEIGSPEMLAPPTPVNQPPAVGMGGGQPAAPAPVSGPDPNHQGPWKLKTNFGLTYEFPDTKGLLGWMSNRDELSGYQLSAGDGDFYPLDQFPQLKRNNNAPPQRTMLGMASVGGLGAAPGVPSAGPPSQPPMRAGTPPQQPIMQSSPSYNPSAGGLGASPSQGAFGAGSPSMGGPASGPMGGMGSMGGPAGMPGPAQGMPAGLGERPEPMRQPGAKITNTEYRPPSKSKNGATTRILVALFIIFGAAVVALSLHIFKIVDFKALILGEEPAPIVKKQPVQPKVDKAVVPDESEESGQLSAEDEKQVEIFIKDAKRSISGNKFADARSKLETALAIAPKKFEIYELLIEVYESTNEKELAEQMKAKVKELRDAQGVEGGESEGGDAPIEDDAVAPPN